LTIQLALALAKKNGDDVVLSVATVEELLEILRILDEIFGNGVQMKYLMGLVKGLSS
jgi:hypothetical protein